MRMKAPELMAVVPRRVRRYSDDPDRLRRSVRKIRVVGVPPSPACKEFYFFPNSRCALKKSESNWLHSSASTPSITSTR
jgi:hypothetical protein